jgi:hypothetical protein
MKSKIVIIALLFSCGINAKTVALLGQWHLLAKKKTTDIEEAKKIGQYPNQKSIYLILKEWVKANKIQVVLAEGCEGEIDEKFTTKFNGWDYKKLKEKLGSKDYSEIMAHVPLKIEVEFKEKIRTICADDIKLIKEHQMAFSELSGNTGFYLRLKQNKGNKKKFDGYVKALEEVVGKKVKNPIEYTRKKALEYLEKEERLLAQRNLHLEKVINRTKENKLALVIGYRHVEQLKKMLEKQGHTVVVPELLNDTLPKDDYKSKLKKIITEKTE